MHAEAAGGPVRALIIVGAHGLGVVMCVARDDFIVNRSFGEDMTNRGFEGVVFCYVVKLMRVVVVVKSGTFALR
jgi:hypothetical protein